MVPLLSSGNGYGTISVIVGPVFQLNSSLVEKVIKYSKTLDHHQS